MTLRDLLESVDECELAEVSITDSQGNEKLVTTRYVKDYLANDDLNMLDRETELVTLTIKEWHKPIDNDFEPTPCLCIQLSE